MSDELAVTVGQYSDKGRKDINQDFHGAVIPDGDTLALKGVAIAIADGVTPSTVSHIASETAVKTFLTDYFATSDAWSVKMSGQRVIAATNSWLHAETARGHPAYDEGRGYMCTLSTLILKGATAHIFHVGDSRVARVSGDVLEPLTTDHTLNVSSDVSYLGRAMGRASVVEIDYMATPVEVGDVFVLTTDGIHGFITQRMIARLVHDHTADLDQAAKAIVEAALAAGSPDNLTAQVVRVDTLPADDATNFILQGADLPIPKIPEPPTHFDGYQLEEQIHASTRSYVYRAHDPDTGQTVAVKLPAYDLRENPGLLNQLMIEEWIARRLSSPFILKAYESPRPRQFRYVVTEYVEGQNLRRWMNDNPKPELDVVRDIVEQVALGLTAFHRKEMIHRDLRPENVMIDPQGGVKIIDLGSVRIAGVAETTVRPEAAEPLLGHMQYMAPECFVGELASARSDIFALGVMTYEMLTGKLPYGVDAARVRTREQQAALRYNDAAGRRRDIPVWVEGALRTATHPDPLKRYQTPSEFVGDLRSPNARFAKNSGTPLRLSNPVRLWQGLSLALALLVVILLALLLV